MEIACLLHSFKLIDPCISLCFSRAESAQRSNYFYLTGNMRCIAETSESEAFSQDCSSKNANPHFLPNHGKYFINPVTVGEKGKSGNEAAFRHHKHTQAQNL